MADEDGLLEIDGLHGGSYDLYVWAEDEGGTDGWIQDADGSNTVFVIEGEVVNEIVEVAVARSARLAGTLVDDEGAPVYGAAVVVSSEDGGTSWVESDRDGRWELRGLGAGSWQVAAVYEAWCEGDPAFVSAWWPGVVNPDWAGAVTLEAGEDREGLDLVMPVDLDQDGMADAWERRWGLDPAVDDAYEDPDGDQYVNVVEYMLDTNPVEEAPGGCGGRAATLLLLGLPLSLRRRRR